MTTPLLVAWISALVVTLAVEVPIVAAIWNHVPGVLPRARAQRVLVAGLPSCVTHPALWFLYWPWWNDLDACRAEVDGRIANELLPACAAMQFYGGEALVVVVEALFFARWGMPLRAAMVVSLLANAVSATFGGWLLYGG
jgi:hypothetical protein